MRIWMWTALVAVALSVTGCGNATMKVKSAMGFDTKMRLVLHARSDLNPDHTGRPSPLIVRIYELRTPTLFERADFIDLFERDEEILGVDLIARHEVRRLTPGDNRVEDLVLSDEARYVAVFAEFTRYQDASHGLMVPVDLHGSARYHVSIEANRLVPGDETGRQ